MATDYVSRDAAIEYLMLNMRWYDEDGWPDDDADEKREAITDLLSGIPAADVAPVRRGEVVFRCCFNRRGRMPLHREQMRPVRGGKPGNELLPQLRGGYEDEGGIICREDTQRYWRRTHWRLGGGGRSGGS